MSYRSNPWSGPPRHHVVNPNRIKSPSAWSPQSDKRLDRFSHAIRARYVVGPDGTLTEVGRDPEFVATPATTLPSILPAVPTLGLRGAGTIPDDDDYVDDDDQVISVPFSTSAPTPMIPQEFMAGPLIGWRMWRVTPKGLLKSVGYGNIGWPPGTPMTGKPTVSNTAGVYAMKSQDLLTTEYSDNDERDFVYGKVALWGKVIEHRKGYRAEFAYPLEIDMRSAATMPGFPSSRYALSLAKRIRARYGCRVLTGPRNSDRTERQSTRD